MGSAGMRQRDGIDKGLTLIDKSGVEAWCKSEDESGGKEYMV